MRILGNRALLFTDIEGSTALLQRIGAAYFDLLDDHHRIMRQCIATWAGEEVQSEGDAFVVLFPTLAAAASFAVDAQQRLGSAPWPADATISVRMGIHWGEVGRSESGFVGLALHEGARVGSAAHGGQVLMSAAARDALEADPDVDQAITIRSLGSFALKDLGVRVPLNQLDHPALRHDFPSPRTAGSALNNLPAQLTSFVGRGLERAAVDELIRQHRLVTLTGSGGVGKTRLALTVAAAAAPRFRDGVWFVELAPLDSEPAVLESFCSALQIDADLRSEREALDALEHRQALVIFDNCEHLVDVVAPFVERLMRSCRDLHVVATSREPLGMVGEVRWRVPSLAASEAVELFAARARQANASLALGAEELATVEHLCDRLDGIPLAIELAAARADSITIEQLARRLLDHFRLLSLGARSSVGRHATLRATLEWSYRLLDADERALLRALAVFRGAPAVESVVAVCVTPTTGSDEVEDLLAALHRKSLLTLDTSRQPPRVQLSEIVRQFAASLLDETGDRPALVERHARHFAHLAAGVRSAYVGGERRQSLRRFADDNENFLAAFDWLELDDALAAALLLADLKEWLVASDSPVWLDRLRRIAERDDVPPAGQAVVNALRALFAGGYGREPAAAAAAAAARAAATIGAVEDRRQRLRALTNLALGSREANPERAGEFALRAEQEAIALADDGEWAWALVDLMYVRDEHHPETRRLRAEALALIDANGARFSNVDPLVDNALMEHQLGHYGEAVRSLERAEHVVARLFPDGELVSEDAVVLTVLGTLIRAEMGDTSLAALVAADMIARIGDRARHQAQDISSSYGQALLLGGRPDEARPAFELAIDRVDGWRYLTVAVGMLGLAMLELDAGQPTAARELVRDIADSNRRQWVRARADDLLAEAALQLGDPAVAAHHIARADRLRADRGFVVPPALRERTHRIRRLLAAAESGRPA